MAPTEVVPPPATPASPAPTRPRGAHPAKKPLGNPKPTQHLVNCYGTGDLAPAKIFSRLKSIRRQNAKVIRFPQKITALDFQQRWTSGRLRIASDNRKPVWKHQKKRGYLRSLLSRDAPVDFLVRECTIPSPEDPDETIVVWDLYDGGNRSTAIMEFVENKLRAPIPVSGIDTVEFDFEHLPTSEQKLFGEQLFDVTVLANASRNFACEMAAKRNEGTPMSTGEKLMLMRHRETQRAQTLNRILDTNPFLNMVSDRATGTAQVAALLFNLEKHPTRCKWTDIHFEKGVRNLFEDPKPFVHVNEEAVLDAYRLVGELCPDGIYAEETERILRESRKVTSKATNFNAACKALVMAHLHHAVEITYETLHCALRRVLAKRSVLASAVNAAIKELVGEEAGAEAVIEGAEA